MFLIFNNQYAIKRPAINKSIKMRGALLAIIFCNSAKYSENAKPIAEIAQIFT